MNHDFWLLTKGIPSKSRGRTVGSHPGSSATPKATARRFSSVMPRLNVAITVNGSISLIGPLLPSANWSVIRYLRCGL